MLDFNSFEEQSSGGQIIPPDSIVPVRMTVLQPKSATSVPGVNVSQSGFQSIQCEFEVMAGQFQGAKFKENFGVGGTTDGHVKAAQIAGRKLRAMVEAVRNINPKDKGQQAIEARRVGSYLEFDGLKFGVVVDCEISKPDNNGKRWVNNLIKKVVTPDHPFYGQVMQGQEKISSNPVPEIPVAPANGPLNTPSFAQRPAAPTAAPSPYAPAPQPMNGVLSNAAGYAQRQPVTAVDDLPF